MNCIEAMQEIGMEIPINLKVIIHVTGKMHSSNYTVNTYRVMCIFTISFPANVLNLQYYNKPRQASCIVNCKSHSSVYLQIFFRLLPDFNTVIAF